MFSSVFDKVISTTAPDALKTFPPRAALPVPSSTLCCLTFADRFLSHYPTRSPPVNDGDIDGIVRLAGRVASVGIAVSANELDSVMQSAADLGGRLAAALAGTARSRNRDPATAPVSDLLTKVRGIFGGRLTSIAREIRVARSGKAERDETLLLRQIHALKNVGLEACGGQKWCIVVSSGGESLVVCVIPLPPVEGTTWGCDFLVFDPWPRPAMKLCGSNIVKFTTVRGLQLHLLSALGEIWREGSLPKEETVKGGFVSLSVVMQVSAGGVSLADAEARRLLEESVTRLRRAEKVAAIKLKREEVETLRRVLGGATKINPATSVAAVADEKISLTGCVGDQHIADNGGIISGSALSRGSEESRQQQGILGVNNEMPDVLLEEAKTDEETVDVFEQVRVHATKRSAPEATRKVQESMLVGDNALGGSETTTGNQLPLLNTGDSSCNRPTLHPPVVGVSPLRSEREGRRRWFEDDHQSPERETIHTPDLVTRTGTTRAANSGRGAVEAHLTVVRNNDTNVEAASEDHGESSGGVGKNLPRLEEQRGAERMDVGPTPDEGKSDNPLHRALLRSVEGEALEEYSKRAYSVYRTHGVIQNGLRDDDWALGARRLTLSTDLHNLGPATYSPIFRPAEKTTRSETLESSSNARLLADRSAECGAVSKGSVAVNSVVHTPVRPFSSPRSLQPVRSNAAERSNSGVDSTRRVTHEAETDSTIENDLRVHKLSAKEEVTQTPDESASLPRAFCSRLRAPRAGRAVALASANARGNGKHGKDYPPGICRELSGDLLPPPPPIAAPDASRTAAWVIQGTPEASGKLELVCPVADKESGDANTEEDSTSSQGNKSPRACRDDFRGACSLPREMGHRNGGEGVTEVVTCSSQGLPSVEYVVENAVCNKNDRDKRCDISAVGDDCSEQTTNHEDINDARANRESSDTPSGRRIKGSAVAAVSSAKIVQLPNKVPRRKSGWPLAVDDHAERDVTPQAVDTKEVSRLSEDGMDILAARSAPLDTDTVGIHRDKTDTIDGVEPTTENRLNWSPQEVLCCAEQPRDDENFLWFGEPDTPSGQPSSEYGEWRRRSSEEIPERDDQTISPTGQLYSKDRFLLCMEIQRQRAIIERAFQAREQEGRARRVRLGAEVFKIIKSTCDSLPLPSSRHRTHARQNKQPGPSSDGAGKGGPLQGLECHAPAYEGSPRHPEHAVKSKGPHILCDQGDPITTGHRSERTTPVEPLPEYTAAASPVPTPPREGVSCAADDHSWRKLSRQTEAEGVLTVRMPTPPSISFEVTADELRGGGGGGNRGGELEQARRQERYEALRARKLVEAEERRREQKDRHAAAKEARWRADAAATATATAVADEGRIKDAEQILRPESLLERQDLAVTNANGIPSSVRGEYTPGSAPRTRPPSSSVSSLDHDLANRAGYAPLGHGNGGSGGGGGGGGGGRTPGAGGGRTSSPVVRGISIRSNRKLVRNALNFLCLAGGHLQEKKKRALEALDTHPASNFVVLLAHTKLLAFKGLYACKAGEEGTADRVFGLGPPQVDATMVSGFYKYNSAAREFREVHSKSLGKTTDAVSMEPTKLRRPKGSVAAQPTP